MVCPIKKSHLLQQEPRPLASLPAWDTGVDHGKFDVLFRRHARYQVEVLKHKPDFLIANPCQFVRGQLFNWPSKQPVRSARWRIQTTEDVHQRRFAASRRTHDADKLSGFHTEMNVIEDSQPFFTRPVSFGHPTKFYHFTVTASPSTSPLGSCTTSSPGCTPLVTSTRVALDSPNCTGT